MKQQLNEQTMKITGSLYPSDGIHAEVKQTITEHKKVMQQWQELFRQEEAGIRAGEKSMYDEVKETIAEHARVMDRWKAILAAEQGKYYVMPRRQVA